MKLLSLYANNFKKLQLRQPLTFTEGIILVTGLNESGKSTILDAILYALFGRMIRPSQKPGNDEIISYGSSDCQVKLDFEIGQTRYRVIREVHRSRPGRALLQEVRPDGTTRNLATSFSETTDEVERLLGGITYNEIVASSVVAQKDLERLIKQRVDDRRKVINIFLNLESFNKVQDELESDRNSIEGTNRNPGRLTVEQRGLERLREQLKLYIEGKMQIETLRERIKASTAELAMLEARYQETDSLFKALNEYDEASQRRRSLETELADKSKLVENLNLQSEQLESRKRELEDANRIIREFDDLPLIRAELDKAAAQVERIQKLRMNEQQLHLTIKNQETTIREKKQARETQTPPPPIHGSQSQNHSWTSLILTAALGAGSILAFLLNMIWATVALGSLAIVFLLLHAKQVASIYSHQDSSLTVSKQEQERLAGLELARLMEQEMKERKRELYSIGEAQSAAAKEGIMLLKTISRFGMDPALANITDPEEGYQILQSLYEKNLQQQKIIESKIGTLKTIVSDGSRLPDRLVQAGRDAELVRQKLDQTEPPRLPVNVIFSKATLRETEEARDELRDQVSRVRTQIDEAQKRQREIAEFVEENKDIEEKTSLQEKNVACLLKELAVLKYALRGIEQTSELLRNRVRPQVERYMGLILPVITSGRYKAVQLDDNYTVRVFDPDAGEFKPKEVFSGGTEDQMLLAMRLAFALALMPQAKGRNPEFLFLDEPLGSSDKIRRDGILALMHKELSRNFKQIFLVSHVGDLEAEANTIIQMENGTVQEIVEKKTNRPIEIAVAA